MTPKETSKQLDAIATRGTHVTQVPFVTLSHYDSVSPAHTALLALIDERNALLNRVIAFRESKGRKGRSVGRKRKEKTIQQKILECPQEDLPALLKELGVMK